jgi:hypothetical protein
MKLSAIQRRFLESISGTPARRSAACGLVTPSTRQATQERLEVYRRAYHSRLVSCLRDLFPALRRALGDEVFTAFAVRYVRDHPPSSYTLGDLGPGFVHFLARPRRSGSRLISELAMLEGALAAACEGPGSEGRPALRAGDLRAIARAPGSRVRIETTPALRLLHFRFPVLDYHAALMRAGKDSEPAPPRPSETFALVSRRDFVVVRTVLTKPQYRLLAALQRGEPLDRAVLRAFDRRLKDEKAAPALLRTWFRDWAAMRLFDGVDAG